MICLNSVRGFPYCVKRIAIRLKPRGTPRPLDLRRQVFHNPHRQHASSSVIPHLESWRLASAASATPDTIYALSTAPGRAAIAVVRISGPACLEVYRRLCPRRPDPKPRFATLRKLYDPDESATPISRVLDNGALVLYFPAPYTATGEDVLELHVHGGPAIVRSILEGISKCGRLNQQHGIRHADAGEFTKRAFYNGKLDLTQAEALGETLAAETEQQRRLAISGADSGLAKRYDEWRTMLLYARGELEALIDFSEDQHFDESPVEFITSVTTQVQALKRQIHLHVRNAFKGELLRTGISIALLGAPNAGKSSLLNRIVGREAAIVSAEEGTTRDIVDVSVDIDGWLCRLGDMAGLRGIRPLTSQGQQSHVGVVEREGIRRARERALESDVVVVLLSVEAQPDGTPAVPINAEVVDAVQQCHAAGKTILVALNKMDMLDDAGQALQAMRSKLNRLLPMIPNERISLISCKDATARTSTAADPGGVHGFLAQLTKAFTDLTTATTGDVGGPMSPAEAQAYWAASLSVTHRQSAYLDECRRHLDDFLDQAQPDDDGRGLDHAHDYHVDRHDDLVGPTTGSARDGLDIVVAAEHLRFAAECLAKITGKGEGGDVEDVLGVVFEK